VGAAACLDGDDPLLVEHAGASEEVRVLGRKDVVGDDGEGDRIA
jgi:hypothetical protein